MGILIRCWWFWALVYLGIAILIFVVLELRREYQHGWTPGRNDLSEIDIALLWPILTAGILVMIVKVNVCDFICKIRGHHNPILIESFYFFGHHTGPIKRIYCKTCGCLIKDLIEDGKQQKD